MGQYGGHVYDTYTLEVYIEARTTMGEDGEVNNGYPR